MNRHSLRTKILVFVGLGVAVGLGVLTTYSSISVRGVAVENARSELAQGSRAIGTGLRMEVLQAAEMAKDLAGILTGIKDESVGLDLSRETIMGVLRRALVTHPQVVGLYTAWEPDALDGMDAMYESTPGHGRTGRFIPLFRPDLSEEEPVIALPEMRLPEGVEPEALELPRYYAAVREAAAPCILPARHNAEGLGGASGIDIVHPIIHDGQFYGVVGVVLSAQAIQDLVVAADLVAAGGEVLVLDEDHHILAASQESLVSQSADDAPESGTVHELHDTAINGETVSLTTDEFMWAASPVGFGALKGGFTVAVRRPVSAATAAATTMTWMQIAIGLGVTMAILVMV